jgi:hypothetical protein
MRKRPFPSGRKTIASRGPGRRSRDARHRRAGSDGPVARGGAGRVPIRRRAARICLRQAALCSAPIVLSSAGCTVARPNASRAVSSVRQYALESTFTTGSPSRRAPRPIARASARPCAERFRCVEQSERTTGSWSALERLVAAWRSTTTSPPARRLCERSGPWAADAPATSVRPDATTSAAASTREDGIGILLRRRASHGTRASERALRRSRPHARQPAATELEPAWRRADVVALLAPSLPTVTTAVPSAPTAPRAS